MRNDYKIAMAISIRTALGCFRRCYTASRDVLGCILSDTERDGALMLCNNALLLVPQQLLTRAALP